MDEQSKQGTGVAGGEKKATWLDPSPAKGLKLDLEKRGRNLLRKGSVGNAGGKRGEPFNERETTLSRKAFASKMDRGQRTCSGKIREISTLE